MTNAAPAAGWFADPHDPSRLRWWDGATWTDHVHPPLVASPVVTSAPVPVASVAAAAPVIEVAATEERILEEYHGNEKEPGLFGKRFRIGVKFGSGRSVHGKATISEVESEPAPVDDATARAEFLASGLTPEQADSAMAVQAKVQSIMEKAQGNPIARKAAHAILRKLAFSTARGDQHEAMHIVFDGRRYRAYGGTLRR